MEYVVPRVLIAGTGSGCGKTTVSCAVLQAFVNRQLSTGAFKCGPDYIDPMFHSRIVGRKSSSLDSFFFSETVLKGLLVKNGAERKINVIEGVMGFYDGLGLTEKASSWEIARLTKTPVILIVGAKGAALSSLAVLEGFRSFRPDSGICGVIFNRCAEMTYAGLKKEVENRFGGAIRPLGFLPPMPDCSIGSRHLGLMTADEVENLEEKLGILAAQAEKIIDLPGILELAGSAPPIRLEEGGSLGRDFFKEPRKKGPSENELSEKGPSEKEPSEAVRIAVARDRAFCFYYEDSLNLLSGLGAELVFFSPLEDQSLPENIHGLYLGGGYPELYAKKLSENITMVRSVREALKKRIPCIAECGGFLYLTEAIGNSPVVGHISGKSFDTGRLTRFGYVRLRAKRDNLLCRAGEEIAAHEFHYWDCEEPGDGFRAEKPSGKSWDCVHVSDVLYAGFPHLHFCANPVFARNFYEACRKEKHRYDRNHEAHGD